MSEIEARDKVKVLLAQSLFGNPDVLLLDESPHPQYAYKLYLKNNGHAIQQLLYFQNQSKNLVTN